MGWNPVCNTLMLEQHNPPKPIMPHVPLRIQPPGAPVFIGGWASDEDFAVHPKGSQPKRTLICPCSETARYLIPNHSYIFKTTKKLWQDKQIWSEVIAYRIGAIAGIDIPPSFIAVDENTGSVGVLMEFFFGFPGELEPARFVHASDYMTRILADKKRGRPHGIRENMKICRTFRLPEVVNWWGRVLAFDALIGNTDRHPDNWGFLVRQSPRQQATYAFAPAFDNGTSLGYEQPEEKLSALCATDQLTAYIRRGTHHCSWDAAEDGPTPHMELCARYLEAYPDAGAAMQSVIRFDQSQIAAICNECTQFDVGIPFTRDRAAFVSSLIGARKAQLAALLGG